jgi:DNA polymerase-3 subunit beta
MKALNFIQVGEGSINVTDLDTYITIRDNKFLGKINLVETKQFTSLFDKSFDGLIQNNDKWSVGQITLTQDTDDVEYPCIQNVMPSVLDKVEHWLTLTPEQLSFLLEGTDKFMGKNDVRYYLNGINIQVTVDGLSVVASDGHKLLIQQTSVKPNFEQSVIIGRTVTKLLSSIKPETNIEVSLIKTDDEYLLIKLEFDNVTIVSRLINSKYPNFEKVIQQQFSYTTIKDIKHCSKILKGIKHFVTDKLKGVKFYIKPDGIKVTNKKDVELCELPIIITGHKLDCIGLNYDYLISLFDNKNLNNPRFKISEDNSCIILEDDNVKLVQMAMRI